MLKKELEYVLKNRRWPEYWRYPSQRGGRYIMLFIVPLLLFLILLIEKDIFIKNEWSDKKNALFTAMCAAIIGALLIILFIQNIKSQSRFIEINTAKKYDLKELLKVAHELNWKGNTSKGTNSIDAIASYNHYFLRQRVTMIILNENQLLFNSYSLTELVVIDRNRDNLKKFLAKIEGNVAG